MSLIYLDLSRFLVVIIIIMTAPDAPIAAGIYPPVRQAMSGSLFVLRQISF